MEFVRETVDECRAVLRAYRALLLGKAGVAATVKEIGAFERFGVTSGTLRVLS